MGNRRKTQPDGFKLTLRGVLECLGFVGEDGGLLLHPDGSAHVIDEYGDDICYISDFIDDIEAAYKDIASLADRQEC